MKSKWSRKWVSSKQPRKQRKFRHNAPLHVRHKFIGAHLALHLRKRYGKRSMPVRKGDEVEVMRGNFKGTKGTVEKVDLKKSKVYLSSVKVKKVDGSEVSKALEPSNLKIISLKLDDKARIKVLNRPKAGPKAVKPGLEKPVEKTKPLAKTEKTGVKKPEPGPKKTGKTEKPALAKKIAETKKPAAKGAASPKPKKQIKTKEKKS